MQPTEIIALKWQESWGIEFTIHPLVWAILILSGVSVLLYGLRRRSLQTHWEPVEIKVPFGGIDVKIVPNYSEFHLSATTGTVRGAVAT